MADRRSKSSSARESNKSDKSRSCEGDSALKSRAGISRRSAFLKRTHAPAVVLRVASNASIPTLLLSQAPIALSKIWFSVFTGHQTFDNTGTSVHAATILAVVSRSRSAIRSRPAFGQSCSIAFNLRPGRGSTKGAKVFIGFNEQASSMLGFVVGNHWIRRNTVRWFKSVPNIPYVGADFAEFGHRAEGYLAGGGFAGNPDLAVVQQAEGAAGEVGAGELHAGPFPAHQPGFGDGNQLADVPAVNSYQRGAGILEICGGSFGDCLRPCDARPGRRRGFATG